MKNRPTEGKEQAVLDRKVLDKLFDVLRERDYRILGPTLRDGAIVYDNLTSVGDLPAGWTDEQDGGTYRLKKRDDKALFGFAVGQHSWKQFFHPPAERLYQVQRAGGMLRIVEEKHETQKLALIGVRSCELAAIAIQDRVFLGGDFVSSSYKARRDQTFILAVNCGLAGGTCFCASMGTGPKADAGYDLALTEVLENQRHYFVVETGSELGASILRDLPQAQVREEEKSAAESAVAKAAGQMGRQMDVTGIKELLYRNYEHPRWDDVAARCLACGNCTMVCPTCFCTTVEDTTDLKGDHAERWQKWDSCFTLDFSYTHGGSVRVTVKSRYRQWMTHKLATWIDQFGTSGCVGCGRCITWCPVGIDITQEVRAIRASARPTRTPAEKDDHGDT